MIRRPATRRVAMFAREIPYIGTTFVLLDARRDADNMMGLE